MGPYRFRLWFMDTFCPYLGAFGRSVMEFRRIVKQMAETARAVHRDRQDYIANETATRGSNQFRKTDVLSNLGGSNQIKVAGPHSLASNSQNGIQGFQYHAR